MLWRTFFCIAGLAALASRRAASAADDWLTRTYRVELTVTGDVDAAAVRSLFAASAGSSVRAAASWPKADKAIAVTVTTEGGGYRVTAIEEDRWLQDTGRPQTMTASSRGLLERAAAAAAVRAFRPRGLVRLEEAQLSAVTWGGALGGETLIPDGGLLRPLIRFVDREGEWRQTQPIAWTFLRAGASDAGITPLTLVSAFRSPLPERIRRGEIVGLYERPGSGAMEVHVIGAVDRRPRAGLTVTASVPGKAGEDDTVLFESRSDRTGRVELPPVEQDIVWVTVRSTTSLANVPVRPGVTRSLTLPVAEDRERIALDERLAAIQLKLTDLAARRAVHVARIRRGIDDKNWRSVEQSLIALDDLPDADSLLTDVNAARVEAVVAAESRGDHGLAARLSRHAGQLEDAIRNFDNPEADAELRSEIEALKMVSESSRE